MSCRCPKGVLSKQLNYKTLHIEKAYVICLLNGNNDRLSVKECRHCVFYPFPKTIKGKK